MTATTSNDPLSYGPRIGLEDAEGKKFQPQPAEDR